MIPSLQSCPALLPTVLGVVDKSIPSSPGKNLKNKETCRRDKRLHLEILKIDYDSVFLLLQKLNHRYALICSNSAPNFKVIL